MQNIVFRSTKIELSAEFVDNTLDWRNQHQTVSLTHSMRYFTVIQPKPYQRSNSGNSYIYITLSELFSDQY